jgi:hypothetical protein
VDLEEIDLARPNVRVETDIREEMGIQRDSSPVRYSDILVFRYSDISIFQYFGSVRYFDISKNIEIKNIELRYSISNIEQPY